MGESPYWERTVMTFSLLSTSAQAIPILRLKNRAGKLECLYSWRISAGSTLEENKELVRAFVAGITVHPEERRLEVRIRKIPAALLPQPGSSVGLVAGAGFEPAAFGL